MIPGGGWVSVYSLISGCVQSIVVRRRSRVQVGLTHSLMWTCSDTLPELESRRLAGWQAGSSNSTQQQQRSHWQSQEPRWEQLHRLSTGEGGAQEGVGALHRGAPHYQTYTDFIQHYTAGTTTPPPTRSRNGAVWATQPTHQLYGDGGGLRTHRAWHSPGATQHNHPPPTLTAQRALRALPPASSSATPRHSNTWALSSETERERERDLPPIISFLWISPSVTLHPYIT